MDGRAGRLPILKRGVVFKLGAAGAFAELYAASAGQAAAAKQRPLPACRVASVASTADRGVAVASTVDRACDDLLVSDVCADQAASVSAVCFGYSVLVLIFPSHVLIVPERRNACKGTSNGG